LTVLITGNKKALREGFSYGKAFFICIFENSYYFCKSKHQTTFTMSKTIEMPKVPSFHWLPKHLNHIAENIIVVTAMSENDGE
jgi:hypothetical protein